LLLLAWALVVRDLAAQESSPWPPMRLTTRQTGLHAVPAGALAAAWDAPATEVRSALAAGRLGLSNQGRPVGYLSEPGGARLLFYAESHRNNYTDNNVYWLSPGTNPTAPVVDGGAPVAVAGSAVPARSEFELDAFIRSELATDPDQDYWLWRWLVGSHPVLGSTRIDFVLPETAAVGMPNRVLVRVLGASAYRHAVSLEVDGCRDPAWQTNWTDRVPFTFAFNVPDTCLRSGTNQLTLRALGPSQSQWWLESFAVEFRRRCAATNGVIEFQSPGPQVVTVAGFAGPDIVLFEVTEPTLPQRVAGATIDPGSGGYRVSFVPTGTGRRYVAMTVGAVLPEPVIAVRTPVGWTGTGHRADLLVIAADDLAAAIQPLVDHRRAQGLEVELASIESVYDEFNFGLREPAALRSFLRYAPSRWALPPSYVLVVGNGTYDPRDLLRKSDNRITPIMIPTPYGMFVSDTALGDVVRLGMKAYHAHGARLTPSAIFQILGDPSLPFAGCAPGAPTIAIGLDPDHAVRLTVQGVRGQALRLWAGGSADAPAAEWVVLTNWVTRDLPFVYREDIGSARARRFYRVTD
jgi:hypothetical protein